MTPLPTVTQVSAGGVAYRLNDQQVEAAIILVGPRLRWQLPKGAINPGEEIEEAARREVNEEAGVVTEIVCLLDRIEFWFYALRAGQRTRFHKFVHFYLMRYLSGNVEDHDHEVEEARWVEIGEAIEMLAFESEREIMRKAREHIRRAAINSRSEEEHLNRNPLG
jgi:8-oxo-dGTP pyrophosphatase MutT (NUDIX family)